MGNILNAPWKLATIGAGVLAAILGFFLFTSTLENRSLTKQKLELVDRIENPHTGYVARLAQANANVVELRTAIQRQNTIIRERENEARQAQAQLEQLRTRLAAAQRETAQMQERLRRFMATPPRGNTLEERVRDVDNRIMEDLRR